MSMIRVTCPLEDFIVRQAIPFLLVQPQRLPITTMDPTVGPFIQVTESTIQTEEHRQLFNLEAFRTTFLPNEEGVIDPPQHKSPARNCQTITPAKFDGETKYNLHHEVSGQRYVTMDEVFDCIREIHNNRAHSNVENTYRAVKAKYKNIPRDMCMLFISGCRSCRNHTANY